MGNQWEKVTQKCNYSKGLVLCTEKWNNKVLFDRCAALYCPPMVIGGIAHVRWTNILCTDSRYTKAIVTMVLDSKQTTPSHGKEDKPWSHTVKLLHSGTWTGLTCSNLNNEGITTRGKKRERERERKREPAVSARSPVTNGKTEALWGRQLWVMLTSSCARAHRLWKESDLKLAV